MFITVQSSREEFLKLSKTLNESSEIKIPLGPEFSKRRKSANLTVGPARDII